MLDDTHPLIRPIKEAFYERAYPIAAELQQEVDAGRMTSEEANRQLVARMRQPDEVAGVLLASQTTKVAH